MGKNTSNPNKIKAPGRTQNGKFAPKPISDLPTALRKIARLEADLGDSASEKDLMIDSLAALRNQIKDLESQLVALYNFRSAYRVLDVEVRRSLCRLAGIETLLMERDGQVRVHAEDAQELLSLVIENLRKMQEHLTELAVESEK